MKACVFQSGRADGLIHLWLRDAKTGETVKVYVDTKIDWDLGHHINAACIEAQRRKKQSDDNDGKWKP